MNIERKLLPSIHAQAAIAVMLIQLVHKIVREIPHASNMGGPGAVAVPLFALLLAIGIVLLFLKIRWGLILGIIDGAWMIFQPILVHVIMATPDINGIWWYPIFPWTQAILIIYFCLLAWNNWEQS
jgi:hypothetical protein